MTVKKMQACHGAVFQSSKSLKKICGKRKIVCRRLENHSQQNGKRFCAE
jgi:hypothetical protein